MTWHNIGSDGISRSIASLAMARVVVIGDAMLDRWVYGRWSKIGGEGIPVFLAERTEEYPGGAANVQSNLFALGCTPVPLHTKLDCDKPIKTRYVNGSHIFRVDEEDCSPITESRIKGILSHLEITQPLPQVIVISDYAKGVCTPELCRRLIAWAKEKGVKVIVDPKGADWSKYRGAAVITPNEDEMEGVQTVDWTGKEDMIITRGSKGMTVYEIGKPHVYIPAATREIFDITGAGDTVVATLAACLAIGIDLPEAARIANAAAGIAVSKRGTATVSLEELETAL